MKDITHYFSDLPKSTESTPVALKEVKPRRAKINDATAVVNEEQPRRKRKRGRVKIKISRKSNESTVCDIIESSTDLVDKTPSPHPNANKRQIVSDDDTPKKLISKSTLESKIQSSMLKNKQNQKNSKGDGNSKSDESAPKEANNSVLNPDQTNHGKACQSKYEDQQISLKKRKEKMKYTEKLIELADKKGYSKRKLIEVEEAVKIEKRIEKRKKFFTPEPNKIELESAQFDENTPKNIDPSNLKRSCNLLNYFSKATPEQLEKERLTNAKVTVKAEIHTPQNSPICSNTSSEKTKNLVKKVKKLNSKPPEENFDEIVLIQSETLVLSPKNEKLKLPLQQNKPKWSLKIQLQSSSACPSDLLDDEEIYTPTASTKSQKENMKNNDKIPKVLLPIKNKKGDISNSPLDGHLNKNENEEKRNVKSNDKEKLKTESVKTESKGKLNNCSKMLSQCETNNVHSKKINVDDDCQIIEENCLKRKAKEKLAPLFTKKIKPNPEVTAARRLFLQSDMQESNNSSDKKKLMIIGAAILPFPKISHVDQLSSNCIIVDQSYRFSLKDNERMKPSFNFANIKTTVKINSLPHSLGTLYECVKSDIETTLSEMESYLSDVRTLWKSISMLSKFESPKRILKTRKRVSDKNNCKIINDNLKNDLLYSPWTDKYRPNSSAEIVGNEEAVQKLKSWLDTWKSSKNNEDYSSSEEFYTSDCSTSAVETNQVAVLVGPHGSGKTASVYAIAQELGYKVLEVNASSKRPGKKILKDFEEATKSHRVKKSNLKDVFTSASIKSEESKKISQNSLILMEDVDLVFEEDEGFISATFQLASNTKRPIVMTLRKTCSYLPKMAPQQLRIDFQPVTGKRVSGLLQLIALAETGYKLSQNFVDALCETGDLRKSLLQLQYLLLSGKKRISSFSLAVKNASWNDMRTHIYKPAIKADKSKRKKQISNDRSFENNILDNLVNSLDNFTLISTLINVEDPTCNLLDLKCEPSMSLLENMDSYSSLENISFEIGNWLNDAIIQLNYNDTRKSNNHVDSNYHQLITKKQINNGVDTVLSQITSNTLDRRALAVDYLSSIRTICRAEEIRNHMNSKRGNRFFHYLQSSRLSSGSMKSNNILSAACKMLQEKPVTISET